MATVADTARPLPDIDADLARWHQDLQHYGDMVTALAAEADAVRHLFDTATARWGPDVWRGKAAGRARKAFDARRHDASTLAHRIEGLAHEARQRAAAAQGAIDGLNIERQQAVQGG